MGWVKERGFTKRLEIAPTFALGAKIFFANLVPRASTFEELPHPQAPVGLIMGLGGKPGGAGIDGSHQSHNAKRTALYQSQSALRTTKDRATPGDELGDRLCGIMSQYVNLKVANK